MANINTNEANLIPLTESMQMYLVSIARLRTDGRPVPLSELADALSISPVSVNEMCRKLQDHGLVDYRPYKGATLTQDGERRAFHILRRHRLWEVFLVEKLGFSYKEAHEAACQLEHATPNAVANRLDAFLGYPSVNPQGEPVPRTDGSLPSRTLVSLAALSAGQRAHVVRCDVGDAARIFLDEQGIRPGVSLTVVAAAAGSVLVQVGEAQLSLAPGLSEAIRLEMERTEEVESTSLQSTSTILKNEEASEMQTKTETAVRQIPLHTLNTGQRGVVVRVGGKGPAKRRMMDMGLVPGSEVEVVRVAPLGDPIEFTVKGYSLSLRKSEAKAITVEVTD
jgi:DtxR family Mn-dependent transcriptional regulator